MGGSDDHSIDSIASKVSVLRVVASFDSEFGGPPVSSASSIAATCDAGVNVTVLSLKRDTDDTGPARTSSLESVGARVISFTVKGLLIRTRVRLGMSFRLLVSLVREVPRHDVIHVHGFWLFSTAAALLVAGCYRKPCVLTPHESTSVFDVASSSRSRFHRFIKQITGRALLPLTSSIVFSSELEKATCAFDLTSKLTSTVYHPVDPVRVRPRRPGSQASVGFLGRLHPKKRVELLMQAVAQIEDCRLVIGGSGDPAYERALRVLASDLGILDRVSWTGFVQGPRKTEFFESIDALVMPSVFENFGMAHAEAVSAGVPVVCTTSTGMAEIISKTGCGVVVSDGVPALVKGVTEALLRSRSGSFEVNCRRAFDDCLSAGVHAEKILRVYKQVLQIKE